ncbi:hypothetical protein HPP92_010659 [Vanilla planifolia]|uniref:AMP-activated protein kinase glycogen-binding domain-containing protein n=1 Tax=Vanilla planifolia TaxID=51239 RepID=A0A835V1N1_VANPL|nr:hypothetical protein HPP92_010659 [Vanilla planifolia]
MLSCAACFHEAQLWREALGSKLVSCFEDTSKDSSGTVGAVLIPIRFVWPHGGRRVFLTGSFTRWSDHLPMSHVEGCPTVFQAICNLSPGLHQYKFNVDGEWRHDVNQPFCVGQLWDSEHLAPKWGPNPVAQLRSGDPWQ